MPTALSADAFVDLVQRSRLMSADQMQQVLRELSEEGTEVDGPQALAQLALDLTDDVDDVGVTLHHHQVGDAYGAVLRDPANVVAAEIHEHPVLRQFLLVRKKVL